MKKYLVTVFLPMWMAMVSCGPGQTVDNSTVPSLDLDRYLGHWYEIARFDHRFERGMEEAEAFYSLRTDGKVDVRNSGVRDGVRKVSRGKAKLTADPARLRVSFFGPFYSDYRVMMLDEDYQYALVGSKGAQYLWILSRTPQLPAETLQAVLAEASRRGYDTSKLIQVRHDGE